MKQLYNASAYKKNKHFKCLLIEQIATAKTGCEKMEAILRKKLLTKLPNYGMTGLILNRTIILT